MQVYVGNVSRHITDAQFREMVAHFGMPGALQVSRDPNGRGKGYAVVEFADPDEARAAVAGLQGKDVDGQILNARSTDDPKSR